MGLFDPGAELKTLALLAVWVAFLSATQDIAFDAYSTDVLRQGQEADALQRDLRHRGPGLQRAGRQGQRQAAGKAQDQQRRYAPAAVDPPAARGHALAGRAGIRVPRLRHARPPPGDSKR